MTQAIARTEPAKTIEQVLIEGDLSRLNTEQKVAYYFRVCESLGLNPYTKPFDYLKLQGREILYARKDATDQLRKLNGVSIVSIEREQVGDLYVVTATARAAGGREDSDVGAVSIKGLFGENLANAMLKAVTKAKRRVTLSICGLGMTDDSEIEAIPGAERVAIELPMDALPAAAVHEATGEVFEDARDALLARWDDACKEADDLKIEHRQLLPHQRERARLEQIETWVEALEGKIFEASATPA